MSHTLFRAHGKREPQTDSSRLGKAHSGPDSRFHRAFSATSDRWVDESGGRHCGLVGGWTERLGHHDHANRRSYDPSKHPVARPGEDVISFALRHHRPSKPRTRWERFLAALSKLVPFWDGDSMFSVRKK